MRVHGKTAIVTGGGTGIGRAASLLLAKEGAAVLVTDINEKTGQETMRLIQDAGGRAHFVKHDVTNEADWIRVAEQAETVFGKVDILYNNAGIFEMGALLDTDVEQWNRMMAINVTGPFLGMKHIVPVMIRGGGGSVINMSSNAGLFGAANMALYGTTKGAVRMLSKNAAMEFAEQGVRVNSVHPGYIHTQMIEYAARVANKQPEDQAEFVPLKRLGQTSDVANMVLFLASDESSYVTGAEFVVDGGVVSGQSIWKKEEVQA